MGKQTVSIDLAGSVADHRGMPVDGAVVSLATAGHTTTTGPSGAFRLTGATAAGAGPDSLLVVKDSQPLGRFLLPGYTCRLGALRPVPAAVRESLILDIGAGAVMVFNRIEAGTFLMGSRPQEAGRGAFFGDPEIRHPVTVSRPYYLGVYKVNQAEYVAVMRRNPSGNYPGDPAPPPPGTNTGDDLPVNHIDYDQATAFAAQVSKVTGRTVRLPTEAEWEMACRAGTQTAYYHGDDVGRLADCAWYTQGSRICRACGLKLPNAWGLYDMPGNVWEFASDYYEWWQTAEPTVDPAGPRTGTDRVLRGGCAPPCDMVVVCVVMGSSGRQTGAGGGGPLGWVCPLSFFFLSAADGHERTRAPTAAGPANPAGRAATQNPRKQLANLPPEWYVWVRLGDNSGSDHGAGRQLRTITGSRPDAAVAPFSYAKTDTAIPSTSRLPRSWCIEEILHPNTKGPPMRIAPVVSAAFSALIAVIVTGASVLIVFYARYQSLLIYQMNIEGDLSKEHVFRVLVPATAIALVVCLAVSLGIGALAASLSSGAVGTAPTPGPAGTIPTTNTTRRSAMKVTLKHSQSGMVKEAPVGFSWTTFFFGFFPALFRGDIKWAAIMFVVAFVTFGISWLVFPFIYNKLYIKGLLESGYVPADDESKSTLTAKGILIQG